jgi:hypothetical protein
MPLLPASFQALALALLLALLLPAPAGRALEGSLRLAAPGLLLLAGGHLVYRMESVKLASQGVLLPVCGGLLGVLVTGPCGLARLDPARVCGLLDPALAALVLMSIAAALTDQLTYLGLVPRWFRSRRPFVAGACLTALGTVTGLRLMGTGGLAPAVTSGPVALLLFATACLLGLFLAGFLHQELLDVWEDLSPRASRRVAWACAVLTLTLSLFSLAAAGCVRATPELPGAIATALLLGSALGLAWTARRLVAWLGERAASPQILLMSEHAPVPMYDDGEYSFDYYSSRLTKGQGPWVFESSPFFFPTHLLGKNLGVATRVLDFPTLDELEAELRRRFYPVVAISFQTIATLKVQSMCRIVRRVSPRSKIVLGGFGIATLDRREPDGSHPLDGLYDHACQGEGVRFMRRLLGEDPEASFDLALPVQYIYPVGLWFSRIQVVPMVVGFGCVQRCDFCATSAFYGGTSIPIATADQLVEQVARAYREHPRVQAIPLFEEDFLADSARARRLAELVQSCPDIPRGAAPFTIFANAASVLEYEPAELVRMGIRHMWIGAESKFAKYPKLQDLDLKKLYDTLYDHGIGLTGSFIIGFDHQSPANLQEDLDWFASLNPTTTQVAVLAASPGTAVARTMGQQGRLADVPWEDSHLYTESVLFKNFAPGEATEWRRRAHRMLFERLGPSLLRMWVVWLRGYRTLRGSGDPALRARAEGLRKDLRRTLPAVFAVRDLAPNAGVMALAVEALEGYEREVGPIEAKHRLLGWGATVWMAARWFRFHVLGKPLRQPVPQRVTYPNRNAPCPPLPAGQGPP